MLESTKKINKWKDRSVKFKTEVICYAYAHTLEETSTKYKVPISTISRWRANEITRIKNYFRYKTKE